MIKCTKKGDVILEGDLNTIVVDILSTIAYFYRMTMEKGSVRLGVQVLDTLLKHINEMKEGIEL